ncbi:DUF4097 family beta strand repeat-containing protein [Haloglomus halophilum]|uniref:DUF4097 family beta strand repeat-containing protein n=1 Tax=Haloglomus halophilum TaxID=2962672 RepID=UPI0020CA1CA4|nr:DUF4097 family beta strand repeat-containing protein [Haloglomus halophilum]
MPSDDRSPDTGHGHDTVTTHSSTRRAFLATGAVATTAALAGCAFGTGALEIERSTNVYSIPADTAIDISNTNGDIIVEPLPEGDDVEVAIVKRTRGNRDRFDRVSVVSAVEDGTLELETDYEGALSSGRVSVDLTVRVPEGHPLVGAGTGNGDVTVSGVAGDATLRSANGDVTADDIDGAPELETANGDVEATGTTGLAGARSANGDVAVELFTLFEALTCSSGNGDVDVGVPSYLPADVELSVGNGDITVEGVDLQNRSGSGNRITGRLVGGGHELTCESGNGDVRLYGLFE